MQLKKNPKEFQTEFSITVAEMMFISAQVSPIDFQNDFDTKCNIKPLNYIDKYE